MLNPENFGIQVIQNLEIGKMKVIEKNQSKF